MNVDEVFALSDGNPYFVSELVASAVGSSVPPTVVDAVLGRLRRLPPAHQEIIGRIGPVAAARCEHAALRGDSTAVINIAEPVLAEAVRLGDQYLQARAGLLAAKGRARC